MQVPLALLADAANVTQTGKLNVLGVFDAIFVKKMPTRFRHVSLVLRFSYHPSERGSKKAVVFKLMDPDGKPVEGAMQQGEINIGPDGPPGSASINLVFPVQWLRFERYGQHELVILINGEHKAEVGINVLPPPTPNLPDG